MQNLTLKPAAWKVLTASANLEDYNVPSLVYHQNNV